MNVTIYTSEKASTETMLQTMIYYSSCSRNLFLKDRFGSIQLIAFVNDFQGTVSCFINATFTFLIVNEGDVNAELLTLISETNAFGTLNVTDQVLAQHLAPRETFEVTFPIFIDLTTHRGFAIETTLTGKAPGGQICHADDILQFTATSPAMPSSLPTASLTPAPHRSATPSPTPGSKSGRPTFSPAIKTGLGIIFPPTSSFVNPPIDQAVISTLAPIPTGSTVPIPFLSSNRSGRPTISSSSPNMGSTFSPTLSSGEIPTSS